LHIMVGDHEDIENDLKSHEHWLCSLLTYK
jgi:hypothetical protein